MYAHLLITINSTPCSFLFGAQGLKELGAEQERLLRDEYARQQKMDEMRLVFAKKAEALHRSMEERVDTLTEIFVVDTVAEVRDSNYSLHGSHGDKKGSLLLYRYRRGYRYRKGAVAPSCIDTGWVL